MLDFIRTIRAGTCPQAREQQEEEAGRDKRWGMNEERVEGDDERDRRKKRREVWAEGRG